MTLKPYMLAACMASGLFLANHASASWFDKITEAVGENISKEDVSKVGETIKQSVSGDSASGGVGFSNAELSQAFKQALEIGSQKVVEQLGQADGFNKDPAIRIPLPEQMQTVKQWLSKVGLDGSLDSFGVSLNRAAENAAPKAKALFVDTIKQMSFDDVKAIYEGGDDAATRFFQEKMTPALTKEMEPVVQQSLSDVGAVKLYDDIIGDYQSIPFVPDVKADMVEHVVNGGLQGIFHYLAVEEAEIRKNPVKRTTELLKKVFGAQ